MTRCHSESLHDSLYLLIAITCGSEPAAMQNHHCALLLGLLVVICLQSFAAANNGKSPEECCFNFYSKAIPVRSIVSYEETRSDCPKAGFVFITKKSARICVDPGFKWVKRAIEQIDVRTVEGSTGF
ncbi:hypothetical protein NFI96_023551 [Prochilodus magdalenae]|nr:hypothetical protein NFI96_023551 [Prochilodus magdalenae]